MFSCCENPGDVSIWCLLCVFLLAVGELRMDKTSTLKEIGSTMITYYRFAQVDPKVVYICWTSSWPGFCVYLPCLNLWDDTCLPYHARQTLSLNSRRKFGRRGWVLRIQAANYEVEWSEANSGAKTSLILSQIMPSSVFSRSHLIVGSRNMADLKLRRAFSPSSIQDE